MTSSLGSTSAPLPSRGAPVASAPAGPEPLVEIRDLVVRYSTRRGLFSRQRDEVVAVDGVDLAIRRGETLGIVGGTGSGKSTVAQVVMGMVRPTSGSVRIAGRDLGGLTRGDRTALRGMVQVVLQDPYSSLDPRMRVRDIIAEPLTVGGGTGGRRSRTEVRARVDELLRLVGLPPAKGDLYPLQFSGGQRQRIALARALAPSPQLIVLDEPTSALDVSVRAQILNLLKSLQEHLGVTYLVISHDMVTVAYLSADIAVMHLGRVVEHGPVRTLYRRPRHPYTLELLASVPGASGEFLRQPRPVTTPDALPAGACRFAYRCALRTALGSPSRCVEEDPRLTEVGPSQAAACHFSEEVDRLARDMRTAE